MTAGLMMAALSSVPAFAGTWKYEYVSNDGHVVTYVEDGKTIFYIGCGRGFALHAKYPGTPKTEGDATIQITTSRDHMTFKGEFEEPLEETAPVPRNFATSFVRTYLGYAKRDPRVFGKAWDAQKGARAQHAGFAFADHNLGQQGQLSASRHRRRQRLAQEARRVPVLRLAGV
jgi:hypothetical protein